MLEDALDEDGILDARDYSQPPAAVLAGLDLGSRAAKAVWSRKRVDNELDCGSELAPQLDEFRPLQNRIGEDVAADVP